MTTPDRAVIAEAVSALANALQVAVPVVARIRERVDAITEDVERLAIAITRAGDTLPRLQPRQDRRAETCPLS